MKTIMGVALLALGMVLASCAGDDTAKTQKMDAEAAAKAAQETLEKSTALKADDPNVVKISVPTIQCETCVETITEGLKAVPAANEVNVDLGSKTVFVKVANNTPETRMELEKAIAGVGYNTDGMKRDSAAYAHLPDCCKEGGMDPKN